MDTIETADAQRVRITQSPARLIDGLDFGGDPDTVCVILDGPSHRYVLMGTTLEEFAQRVLITAGIHDAVKSAADELDRQVREQDLPSVQQLNADDEPIGIRGVRQAERMLVHQGYEVLDRGYQHGEGTHVTVIDLVCRHRDDVVFVTVRTRSSDAFGHPFETITPEKLQRMRVAGGAWLAQRDDLTLNPLRQRIDVIAVIGPKGKPVSVEHLEGVG